MATINRKHSLIKDQREKKTDEKNVKKEDQYFPIVNKISDRIEKNQTEELLRKERNFISAILETTGALVILLDSQGRFIRINDAFEKLLGRTILELVGIPFWDVMLPDQEVKDFKAIFDRIMAGDYPLEYKCHMLARNGKQYLIVCSITALKDEDGNIEYIIYTGIDVSALQDALNTIKTLRGLIPICSNCKKIRDDHGYWNKLEEYIREHSQAHFTHSLCPDCINKLYPEYAPGKTKH